MGILWVVGTAISVMAYKDDRVVGAGLGVTYQDGRARQARYVSALWAL